MGDRLGILSVVDFFSLVVVVFFFSSISILLLVHEGSVAERSKALV